MWNQAEQISSTWRRNQRAALDATPIIHPTATASKSRILAGPA